MEKDDRNRPPVGRARQLFLPALPVDQDDVEQEVKTLLAVTHFSLEQEQAFIEADKAWAESKKELTDEKRNFIQLCNDQAAILSKPSSEAAKIRKEVKQYKEKYPNTKEAARLAEIEENTIAQIRHKKASKKNN